MFAENLRGKHFANILVLTILLMGALVVFLVALASSQSSGVILAAPGQAITDSITFSEYHGDYISIILPTFDPLDLSPKNSPYTLKSKTQTPLIVTESGCSVNVAVSANNDGCLSQFDQANSAYVSGGKKLQNSMKISADGTNFVDLSTGGVLISGENSPYSTDVTLSQVVAWQDQPLQNSNVYRIEISFIVSEQMCG